MSNEKIYILPKYLRLKDIPHYLRISTETFNKRLRPHLAEYSFAGNMVAFDREEIDRLLDVYWNGDSRHGGIRKEAKPLPCDDENHTPLKGSASGGKSGTSIQPLWVRELEKALERPTTKKR